MLPFSNSKQKAGQRIMVQTEVIENCDGWVLLFETNKDELMDDRSLKLGGKTPQIVPK
jgi:hypothetical protein